MPDKPFCLWQNEKNAPLSKQFLNLIEKLQVIQNWKSNNAKIADIVISPNTALRHNYYVCQNEINNE
jgi:hypothetical protein